MSYRGCGDLFDGLAADEAFEVEQQAREKADQDACELRSTRLDALVAEAVQMIELKQRGAEIEALADQGEWP